LSKLKFGVFLPFYAFQAKEHGGSFSLIRNIVLDCERLGYHSVWLDDHLMYDDWPILESWTTLSALSALTSRVRLGTMISCSAHRNPALLAKMAATFDVLSNGRLELGIGAGIQENEHTAYGFDFPEPSVRIERLGEYLEVIKRLWTQNRANYQGKHYSLKDAVCEPKPLQKPYPPITVGGCSELLLRKVTAPYADRFDFGFLPSIERYKRKLGVLEKECMAIGRNLGKIEKSCWPGGQVLIAQNEREVNEKVSQKNALGLSLEDFKKTTLVGTPQECREQLQVYVDLGVTCFMLYFGDLPKVDGLRLFAEGVVNSMSG
jgi:alkanesulfonate monooxygenase SsuD/methylene tetrahydromethanopterin reductase-like flavin-dependent oxidoreductase (luciferase family)